MTDEGEKRVGISARGCWVVGGEGKVEGEGFMTWNRRMEVREARATSRGDVVDFVNFALEVGGVELIGSPENGGWRGKWKRESRSVRSPTEETAEIWRMSHGIWKAGGSGFEEEGRAEDGIERRETEGF